MSTSLGVLGLNGLTAYFGMLDIGRPKTGQTVVVSKAAGSAACPAGVDVCFDNTAGRISDAVLEHLAVGARVVVCGTASVARWSPAPPGPRGERHLLVKSASMQGLLAMDHEARHPGVLEELAQWVGAGRIRYREDILDGIEQAPGAMAGLYRGENLGKRLIRLDEADA